MAAGIDKGAFVREGLFRYAEARETVKFFESCIYELLMRTFESKVSWAHFQPLRTQNGLELTKAPGALHVYLAGHVPGRSLLTKVWLDIGIVWNPTLRRSKAVVLCANCWIDKTGAAVPFNAPPSVTGPQIGGLYRRSERKLLLDVAPDSDIEQLLAELLDAADDALGPEEGGAAVRA